MDGGLLHEINKLPPLERLTQVFSIQIGGVRSIQAGTNGSTIFRDQYYTLQELL